MDFTVLLHAHKGIIYLFLTVYILKVALLFLNLDFFEKVQKKGKIIEMILGPLIIISGIMLLVQRGQTETWLIVKIVLIAVAIPVSIIGLKKVNKGLALLGLALFVYVFLVALHKSLRIVQLHKELKLDNTEVLSGNFIRFDSNDCNRVHGTKKNNNELPLRKDHCLGQNQHQEKTLSPSLSTSLNSYIKAL